MAKLLIKGSEGWGDCEDCGSYNWENYEVYLDGKKILDHTADDHLGGGVWYSWQSVVEELLPALGIEVEIDIEYQGA